MFPNPITNSENLNLSFYLTEQLSTEYLIINYSGRIVLSEYVEFEKGLNEMKIRVSTLQRGIYFIVIPNITQEKVLKLIVQ